MGEDAKLFIGQGIRIMVGDKPVGFAKEGMLTYNIEDDGSTKDGGAWMNPMRHSYEITGEAVVTNVGDPIRELLNDMPRKVDVEIRREMGKMPRKMKKALHSKRMSKWKQKVASYISRRQVRIHDAEMVVMPDQFDTLKATISGGTIEHGCVVSGKQISEALERYKHRRN